MVSISSSTNIRNRTEKFCRKISNWNINNKTILFNQIYELLESELNLIPEKERIGKGVVYISKYIAKEIVSFIKNRLEKDNDYYLEFVSKGFFLEKQRKIIIFVFLYYHFFLNLLLIFRIILRRL
ncbi:MAG: hypothetical protein JXA99_08340 [Candidatus Lokiarchaeota archaeon]|nr:hypothetical protein [Candidatus Lokiarchaeota archaeon]